MDYRELLATAERDGLKVRFGPCLPVPTPRRWARLSDDSGHSVWLIEPEQAARRKAALEARRRLFVARVRLRMQRGPDVVREVRVKATTAAVAAGDALREVRAVVGRRRVRAYELTVVRA